MPIDPLGGEPSTSSFPARLFIASGVFVALVVLLAVYVIVEGSGRSDDKAGRPHASSPAPTSSAPAPTGTGNGCPTLADTATTVPDAAPQGVIWALVDGFALPSQSTRMAYSCIPWPVRARGHRQWPWGA
ncbi:hypothetical protein [Streptomyces alanosinicus]|uniref:Uncharacterized protein n=1 Tax=Streptomyces alanosinicus TaxID=68171 RepID=A0A918YSB3_9ACTN|nr:hypothetical protein [Streptomyces alanosinicus]GHE13322.1 hypothetical protein GCM10010339_79880 [Streptomyces alanosinicus]